MPGLSDTCHKCRQIFVYSLPRCGFCRKPVCGNCGSRVGGSVFCSRTCSHAFFYSGDEDVEEERAGVDQEDE